MHSLQPYMTDDMRKSCLVVPSGRQCLQ